MGDAEVGPHWGVRRRLGMKVMCTGFGSCVSNVRTHIHIWCVFEFPVLCSKMPREQHQSKIVFVLATRRLFVAPILSITFTPRCEWNGEDRRYKQRLCCHYKKGLGGRCPQFFLYIQRRRTRNQNTRTSCAIADAHTSSEKKKKGGPLCLRVLFVQVKFSNKFKKNIAAHFTSFAPTAS